MKKIVICFVCIIAMLASLAACNRGADSASENKGGAASADQSASLSNYTVNTDYAVLTLPLQYIDAVQATVDTDCVSLVSGEQKLLDLYFNSDQGTALGTFSSEKGEVKLSMMPYDVPAGSDYTAMQDDCLNEILKGLMKDYSFKASK